MKKLLFAYILFTGFLGGMLFWQNQSFDKELDEVDAAAYLAGVRDGKLNAVLSAGYVLESEEDWDGSWTTFELIDVNQRCIFNTQTYRLKCGASNVRPTVL